MKKRSTAPETFNANEQATTTTFDVVETQQILRQLTGNSGRIYRRETEPARVRWMRNLRRWLGRADPHGRDASGSG
jgi:hypothetical protein